MTNTIKRITLSAKEYAAIMRKDLKAAFPGIKFTCAMASGGGVVNIRYTDGPKKEEVEAVAFKYGEKNFDGMTDCSYQDDTMILTEDGPVKYSVYAYIYVNRDFSDEATSRAEQAIALGWRVKSSIEYKYERRNFDGSINEVLTLLAASDLRKKEG